MKNVQTLDFTPVYQVSTPVVHLVFSASDALRTLIVLPKSRSLSTASDAKKHHFVTQSTSSKTSTVAASERATIATKRPPFLRKEAFDGHTRLAVTTRAGAETKTIHCITLSEDVVVAIRKAVRHG